MNDEDWMKKRSWRRNSGCSFLILVSIGIAALTSTYLQVVQPIFFGPTS